MLKKTSVVFNLIPVSCYLRTRSWQSLLVWLIVLLFCGAVSAQEEPDTRSDFNAQGRAVQNADADYLAPIDVPQVQVSPTGELIEAAGDLPLTRFMTQPEQIMIRNADGSYRLTVPIPDRREVEELTLTVDFTNSISLLEGRSQLVVLWDDRVMGQVALTPRKTHGRITINIPARMLKAGYHELRFDTAIHTQPECEDPSAPELWVAIDSETSFMKFIQQDYVIESPRLSRLDQYFDEKELRPQTVNIVVPSGLSDPGRLRAAALAAQGIALRYRYQPVFFTFDTAIRPAVDNVVIGNAAEIQAATGFVPDTEGAGPGIGITPIKQNEKQLALLLIGSTPEEMGLAAEALGALRMPLPETNFTWVRDLQVRELASPDRPGSVLPGKRYAFEDLGIETNTVKGMLGGGFELEIFFPPNLWTRETREVDLLLHFAYGANLRRDSVLNIFLNEQFERAIPLNILEGAVFDGYEIPIPLRSFEPGLNKIEITPRMMPLLTGNCEAIQDENLLFTLYGDSVLSLPHASRIVEQPDLRLFARTAFPAAYPSTGAGTTFWLSDGADDAAAAFFTLVGKLAQKIGAPLYDADYSTSRPSAANNLVVVGSINQIDIQLMRGAAMQFNLTGNVIPQPSQELPEMLDRFENEDGTSVERLKSIPAKTAPAAQSIVSLSAALADGAALMQFESPFAPKQSAFLLTAVRPDLLKLNTNRVVTPPYWEALKEDIAVWSEGHESLVTESAAAKFVVGQVDPLTRVEYTFSQRPWIWVAVIVGVVILLTVLIGWLLKKRMKS